mgnify:CR=1 FL=1
MTQMSNNVAETAVYQQTLEQIRNKVKFALEEAMGDSSAEILEEMSSIFLEDVVPLIYQMNVGYANQHYIAIQMAAHALKGSSATMGLDSFADLCQAIEGSSKLMQNSLISRNIAALEAEYAQVKRALNAFLI